MWRPDQLMLVKSGSCSLASLHQQDQHGRTERCSALKQHYCMPTGKGLLAGHAFTLYLKQGLLQQG